MVASLAIVHTLTLVFCSKLLAFVLTKAYFKDSSWLHIPEVSCSECVE